MSTFSGEDQSSPSPKSRYIPAQIKQQVWQKSKGQCAYKDPLTGKICGSKRYLEIDHIKSYSQNGPNTLDNLQLLCDAHNRWKYRHVYKTLPVFRF